MTTETVNLKEPRRISIRTRIGLAMVLLVVLSLAVTGAIVMVLQSRSNLERIERYLDRTREEFTYLATEGLDPETGERFTNPTELLRAFLARTVIDPHEGEVGVVEGKVRWGSSINVALRPEDDEVLMRYLLPLSEGDSIVKGTIQTPDGKYRYLVVPVKFPNEAGALIHVYDLGAADAEMRQLLLAFLSVALITALLSAGIAWVMVGQLLRPVEDLRLAADSISENDLTSRVPLRGNDDLTQLSRTVNRMLDRVESSVITQRKLLDDVGHELRTPLTIVRGHLELIDPDDPADVRATRDLTLDELDRMGTLVGDLLILAKANQSDFVQPQWYSLATLTDQVLEKSRALGNRHWRLRHIASADAWLDPNRITQAWLQLAANAVRYSDDGSAITFGSEVDNGEVRLYVEDNGVGIAPEELRTIRTRFGRGTNARDVTGAGLGLSIVETIVAAHDGRLAIDSHLGEGSTFTIIIPLTPKETPDEHDPDH